MFDPITWAVAAALLFVLLLLSLWQEKITENQRDEALADQYEARRLGTDKAIAQYPMIDIQSCIGCGSCVDACPENDVLRIVDSVAQVVHGSRCIGHAHCEEACPVAAIKVGLGDISLRPDIPVLSEDFESSLEGVYIAGELGGMALIRIAVEQGTSAVDSIAFDLQGEMKSEDSELLDLLIVGSGPAGLAASLRAKELGLRYATIDQDDVGGTVRKYPRRKLTLTGRLTLPLYGLVERQEYPKEELIEFWEELIETYDLQIQSQVKLFGVNGKKGSFSAHTTRGPMHTKRVLLALGRRGVPRRLGVPGESLEKVQYQLVDAHSYQNQNILVVGGGDSAIEAAMALANQSGNSVTLSYRRSNFFRLKQRNEERIGQYRNKINVVFNSTLKEVDKHFATLECDESEGQGEDGELRTVKVKNDYVFVFAGGEPPYQFLKQMGIQFGGESQEVEEDALTAQSV